MLEVCDFCVKFFDGWYLLERAKVGAPSVMLEFPGEVHAFRENVVA